MLIVYPVKDKLYRKFKGGDIGALADLLEGERADVYDYLMRMTGDMTRSIETIDEVYQSLTEETLAAITSYAELKLCIYVTARKFNADIWNANTTRLVNAAFETPSGAASERQEPSDRQALAMLDRALRSLPGPEREAAWLRVRGGCEYGEIAEIMSMSEPAAETQVSSGLRRIDAECKEILGAADMALARLPNHPPPVRSSQATVNLSMVMQGIKTKHVGLWSPLRLTMLGLLAAAGLSWFLWPQLAARLWDAVKPAPHLGTGSGG